MSHIPIKPEALLQDLRSRNTDHWAVSNKRAIEKIIARDELVVKNSVKRLDLLDAMESMIGWAESYRRYLIKNDFNDMVLTPLSIDIDNAKHALDAWNGKTDS